MSDGAGLIRPALAGLIPYEPGKPVEEVQRELGLERVVKLASNEGPLGPFPGALAAMEGASADLNRYPDGGAYRLRAALADRHGVRFEEIAVGSGADGVIDGLSQAVLDPGDELVCGWPSFASYVIYALKLGAEPVRVPLQDYRYDLEALLAAITPRTKLVYICHPNNPTGTMNTRAELDAYFARVPGHVLTVLDQAYFEYIDDPDYADGVEEYFRQGRKVVVLRTFSKIYGLAGVRVGYGVASPDLVTELGKTRRAFDITTPGQEAALASLDAPAELARRRDLNREGRAELERLLRDAGYDVIPGSMGNFVYVEVGDDAPALFDSLLRQGVIVRPLAGFGAPHAIRVTVGTPDEHAFLADALARVHAAA
ncbi:MAG TPA: histidinol-phosphate transaminase [Gaiellaceae bacterium]|nr:histidinol-phosphate transaminase [Gaiellaceae bacterium]